MTEPALNIVHAERDGPDDFFERAFAELEQDLRLIEGGYHAQIGLAAVLGRAAERHAQDAAPLDGATHSFAVGPIDGEAVLPLHAEPAADHGIMAVKATLGVNSPRQGARSHTSRAEAEPQTTWSVIEERLAAMAERMEAAEAVLSHGPQVQVIEALEQRLEGVSAELHEFQSSVGSDVIVSRMREIEERLDEIAEAVVVVADRSAGIDQDRVEAIENHVQVVCKRVNAIEDRRQALKWQLVDLSSRIETASAGSEMADLAERTNELLRRGTATLTAAEESSARDGAIQIRLETLETRLDESGPRQIDQAILQELQAKVVSLLEGDGENEPSHDIADLAMDMRVSTLEQALERHEDASRIGRRVAEDVARRDQGDFGASWRAIETLASEISEFGAETRAGEAEALGACATLQACVRQLNERVERLTGLLASADRDDLRLARTSADHVPDLLPNQAAGQRRQVG